MENTVFIKPTQCKAARCLLEWNQVDLSKKAKVGINTVIDFEKGKRKNIGMITMEKIMNAFIDNGIIFENTADRIIISLKIENQK